MIMLFLEDASSDTVDTSIDNNSSVVRIVPGYDPNVINNAILAQVYELELLALFYLRHSYKHLHQRLRLFQK